MKRPWIYAVSIILLFLMQGKLLEAQADSLVEQIYAVLFIDPITITARQSGPDVKSMIRQTIYDTTFYRAFQRLRRTEYRFSSALYFYQPGWIPYTLMRSLRLQQIEKGQRSNKVLEEYIDRNMKDKKGNYRFYTAQMYDRIFFTEKPVPVPQSDFQKMDVEKEPEGRMEKYIQDLKLLLFAPGTTIDIPLMGKRPALFEKDMMPYYNYFISPDTISPSRPVYIFSIKAKPDTAEKETVIKEMETIFDQQTMQILGRSYKLKYKTILYSFDVSMQIEVKKHNNNYYPVMIDYKGHWNVPFKKPEWCHFTFHIEEFL